MEGVSSGPLHWFKWLTACHVSLPVYWDGPLRINTPQFRGWHNWVTYLWHSNNGNCIYIDCATFIATVVQKQNSNPDHWSRIFFTKFSVLLQGSIYGAFPSHWWWPLKAKLCQWSHIVVTIAKLLLDAYDTVSMKKTCLHTKLTKVETFDHVSSEQVRHQSMWISENRKINTLKAEWWRT